MNSIFTRRSVRQFKDQAVEAEKIESLLKAGMQAPSAWGQKAWNFIVVEGRENLDRLSQYNPYAGCLRGAAFGIIVLGNTSVMKAPEYWEQDLGAATQNILLQAVEEGLGAVWLGVAPEEDRMKHIMDLYSLGKELIPYSVIAVGYPATEDANHYVDRFDSSRVQYIR